MGENFLDPLDNGKVILVYCIQLHLYTSLDKRANIEPGFTIRPGSGRNHIRKTTGDDWEKRDGPHRFREPVVAANRRGSRC